MLCIRKLRKGTQGRGIPSHVADAHLWTGIFVQLCQITVEGQRWFLYMLDLCLVIHLHKTDHFRVSLKCIES